MKLIDVYQNIKEKYPDAVAFIKSGKFYLTFDNDASICNLLCGYKIVNNKLGFPEGVCEKVKKIFEDKQIDFFIDDNIFSFEGNNYYLWLKKDSDDLIVNNMVKTLNGVIKTKLENNFNNYDRIRKFLNEL